MLRITLDTNCLIDLEAEGPNANAIRVLLTAHREGRITLFLPAISASERQRDGHFSDFGEFERRLTSLGLGKIPTVLPMAYMDISFSDHALYADDAMVRLEREIHAILFEQHAFEWNPEQTQTTYRKWLNRKCDVQAIWSHINAGNDVFVTGDANFHKFTKRTQLIALGAKQLETPLSVAALLE